VAQLLANAPSVIAEVPGADHGSFGDDAVHRAFLGDVDHATVTTHARDAAVLEFLGAALDENYDGQRLAATLTSAGMNVGFAAPRPTER
jgi:hypothetical protein